MMTAEDEQRIKGWIELVRQALKADLEKIRLDGISDLNRRFMVMEQEMGKIVDDVNCYQERCRVQDTKMLLARLDALGGHVDCLDNAYTEDAQMCRKRFDDVASAMREVLRKFRAVGCDGAAGIAGWSYE